MDISSRRKNRSNSCKLIIRHDILQIYFFRVREILARFAKASSSRIFVASNRFLKCNWSVFCIYIFITKINRCQPVCIYPSWNKVAAIKSWYAVAKCRVEATASDFFLQCTSLWLNSASYDMHFIYLLQIYDHEIKFVASS